MKKTINKLIMLAILFIVVVAAYFILSYEPKKEEVEIMGGATLPIITMSMDNSDINVLHGYVMNMNGCYMRDSVTPLPTDHKVNIKVNTYGSKVNKISFEVRSLDTTRLVENTEVSDWSTDGNTVQAVLTLSNLMDANKEYLLKITLATDSHDEIYYYTRVLNAYNSVYKDQMSFAYQFSDATFDKDKAEDYVNYIEPNASQDNTNLGHVTIYSNFNQLTWGKLAPTKVTTPIVTLKELNGDIGCYELKYQVKAKSDNDADEHYNVTEFFRIRTANNKIYLLSYERTMDQVFEPSTDVITASKIDLGVSSTEDTDYTMDEKGTYIGFSKERELWCLDTDKDQILSLFTFTDSSDDGVRDTYDQHGVKLIKIDKDGNADFIVYGYMNRGEHEGMTGVTLYQYKKKTKTVNEVLFIPSEKPYQILKETLGQLAYVNQDNMLYIMLDDNIYSIDLTGEEFVKVVSGLKEGSFVINRKNSMIAWQEGDSVYNASAINVLNLDTGTDYRIDAGEGQKIRVLGFMENDLVFGIANQSDILTDQNGQTTFPMQELRIVSGDTQEVLISYHKDGIYITEATMQTEMINLKRVTKNEDESGYTATDDDQIINNQPEEQDQKITISSETSDRKKKTVSMNLTSQINTANSFEITTPVEVLFNKSNDLTIPPEESANKNYYVYGKGKLLEIYNSAILAIQRADTESGVVTDDNQNVVWLRGIRPSKASVTGTSITASADTATHAALCIDAILQINEVSVDVSGQLAAGKTPVTILDENLDGRGLDLTGCTLAQVLYLVSVGQPVMGAVNGDDQVLITGYDANYVYYINPTSGETDFGTTASVQSMFEQAGNKFVSVTDKN